MTSPRARSGGVGILIGGIGPGGEPALRTCLRMAADGMEERPDDGAPDVAAASPVGPDPESRRMRTVSGLIVGMVRRQDHRRTEPDAGGGSSQRRAARAIVSPAAAAGLRGLLVGETYLAASTGSSPPPWRSRGECHGRSVRPRARARADQGAVQQVEQRHGVGLRRPRRALWPGCSPRVGRWARKSSTRLIGSSTSRTLRDRSAGMKGFVETARPLEQAPPDDVVAGVALT